MWLRRREGRDGTGTTPIESSARGQGRRKATGSEANVVSAVLLLGLPHSAGWTRSHARPTRLLDSTGRPRQLLPPPNHQLLPPFLSPSKPKSRPLCTPPTLVSFPSLPPPAPPPSSSASSSKALPAVTQHPSPRHARRRPPPDARLAPRPRRPRPVAPLFGQRPLAPRQPGPAQDALALARPPHRRRRPHGRRGAAGPRAPRAPSAARGQALLRRSQLIEVGCRFGQRDVVGLCLPVGQRLIVRLALVVVGRRLRLLFPRQPGQRRRLDRRGHVYFDRLHDRLLVPARHDVHGRRRHDDVDPCYHHLVGRRCCYLDSLDRRPGRRRTLLW